MEKDSVVICHGAQVIGDVELGENVSVWHGAVIRGDVASIKIGNNSNVQDNCVVHCSKDFPTVIKDNVSSNVILFASFEEALEYAQKDAKLYKHLASTYVERIGINKLHADIKLRGKYINKTYRVSDIKCGGSAWETTVLGHHPNTYMSFDYDSKDNMF